MNLDGARNVKAEVFQEAFGFKQVPFALSADLHPVFAPEPDTEAYVAIKRARQSRQSEARDLVALAVLDTSGHNRNPDDLSLGILLQRKRLIDHPIVQRAQRIARGEVAVIFTGPVRSYSALNVGRCRPMQIGASIGHERIGAGTLGGFAVKRSGGGIGILSNNHVLANCNRSQAGDRIMQPGRIDGGRRQHPDDHVAILDKFEPLSFETGTVNFVDCAFAYVVDGVRCDCLTVRVPSLTSHPKEWRVGAPDDLVYPTLPVKKLGRTTALTSGAVQAAEVDNLRVGFAFGNNPLYARFDRQIGIVNRDAAFSKPGDSGSLIFNDEDRPIALLFAGSERSAGNGPGITFANPIGTVLDALDVDVYTGA